MTAPWNVRVTPGYTNWLSRIRRARPDWYLSEIRVGDDWEDVGTSKTWWGAFWQGVAA